MKWFIFLFFSLFIFLPGCEMHKREQELKVKVAELNQKEQELLLKEKSLQLKQEELAKREKLLDSTAFQNSIDTLSALHPNLPGLWNVTMRCTETTCTGSAVGDTKKEQWEISFQNNTVIAKAMSDNKLLRVYSGTYEGSLFELSAQQDNVVTAPSAKMIVRLQKTKENEMAGQREIIRPEECRIVYALELSKQQ